MLDRYGVFMYSKRIFLEKDNIKIYDIYKRLTDFCYVFDAFDTVTLRPRLLCVPRQLFKTLVYPFSKEEVKVGLALGFKTEWKY